MKNGNQIQVLVSLGVTTTQKGNPLTKSFLSLGMALGLAAALAQSAQAAEGYLVGPNNKVFFTDNSGQNWTTYDLTGSLPAGSVRSYTDVAAFKNTIIVEGTRGGGSGVSDPNGYSYVSSGVMQSNDHGATWSPIGPTNYYWDNWSYIPHNHSILSPSTVVLMPAGDVYSWRSANLRYVGSAATPGNWTPSAETRIGYVNNYSFISANDGWAGINGGIMHTSDGGVTWGSQFASGANMRLISMADATHGVAIDGLNTYYTSDGSTWQAGAALTGGVASTDIDMVTGQVGYVSGWDWDNACVWKTTDGGQNWALQGLPTPSDWIELVGIQAYDVNTVWTVGRLHPASGRSGGNYLVETTNGGASWQILPLPYAIANSSAERYIGVYLVPEPGALALLALGALAILRRRRR